MLEQSVPEGLHPVEGPTLGQLSREREPTLEQGKNLRSSSP